MGEFPTSPPLYPPPRCEQATADTHWPVLTQKQGTTGYLQCPSFFRSPEVQMNLQIRYRLVLCDFEVLAPRFPSYLLLQIIAGWHRAHIIQLCGRVLFLCSFFFDGREQRLGAWPRKMAFVQLLKARGSY